MLVQIPSVMLHNFVGLQVGGCVQILFRERAGAACRWEGVHKLAWLLDVCVRSGNVSDERLAELKTMFDTLAPPEATKEGKKKRRRKVEDEESVQRGTQGAPLLDSMNCQGLGCQAPNAASGGQRIDIHGCGCSESSIEYVTHA
jgi:hypothetical protein